MKNSNYAITLLLLIFLLGKKTTTFSQIINIGLTTDAGYEFYDNLVGENIELSDQYNPTLGAGIIAELEGDAGVLFSIGYKINRSQRKYSHVRKSYIESLDFTNKRYKIRDRIVDASNMTISIGFRKNRFKFLVGAQFSSVLQIKDYNSYDVTISSTSADGSEVESSNKEEKQSVDLALELKFIPLKKVEFSLRFAHDSRSDNYNDIHPKNRITIGTQLFLVQKHFNTQLDIPDNFTF